MDGFVLFCFFFALVYLSASPFPSMCASVWVCVCHKRFAWGLSKDVYLWLLVFSLVFLLSSIAVVKSLQSLSFLLSLFLFHKDLSTARGALRLLLGSQILLFLFSLPAIPPPPCLFFEADVNRCLQWAVYLSLPRLVLSSDPRVNALQRSIILLLLAPDGGMKRGKRERDIQRLRKSRKQSHNKHLR